MNTPAGSHSTFFITAGRLLCLAACFCLASLSGCASTPAEKPNANATLAKAVSTEDAAAKFSRDYVIQTGDQIDVKLFFNPELNDTVIVRPDGKVSLQLLDDVQAAGLTPAQLDDEITRAYSKEVKNPVVTVILRLMAEPRVYVGGDVEKPGYVTVKSSAGVLQAIVEAGGFLDSASIEDVKLLRKGPDNRPIPIDVNVERIIEGQVSDSDFTLQATDVVYVPRKGFAQAADFMQRLGKILLINGFFLPL